MRRHSGQQQFYQACVIAQEHNMFVVDRGGTYLVYRKATPRNAYLGSCSSAEALFKKVSACAEVKTGAPS